MWPYDDLPIPAPAAWSRAEAYAGMDDMGEHALRSGRLTVGDLDRAISSKIAAALEQPQEAASACSEFLAPVDKPTRRWSDRVLDFAAFCVLAVALAMMDEPKRAGRMQPWKAQMLNAKAACWSVLGLLAMTAVLWSAKP